MIALDAARWLVERTIAWLNRCRRLAKDWENLNHKALTFLRLASIRSCSENFVIPLDVPGRTRTLQLLLWEMSESMGNHDSEVVDASSVD
jgi:hypothetical protein